MIGDDIRAEAERYASESERFSFLCVEVEVQADDQKYLVLLSEDDAHCSCPFFQKWKTCSHVMAAKLFLGRSISFELAATTDTDWSKKIQFYNTTDLAITSGLARTTIVEIKAGNYVPTRKNVINALRCGIELLEKHLDFEKWKEKPIQELARILEMDEKDASCFRYGLFKPTRKQRKALLDSMGITEQ